MVINPSFMGKVQKKDYKRYQWEFRMIPHWVTVRFTKVDENEERLG